MHSGTKKKTETAFEQRNSLNPKSRRSCIGFCHGWENETLRGTTTATDTQLDFKTPLTEQSAHSDTRLWHRHHVTATHSSYLNFFSTSRESTKTQNPASAIVNFNTSAYRFYKGRLSAAQHPQPVLGNFSKSVCRRRETLGRGRGGRTHRISHRRREALAHESKRTHLR